MNPFQIIGVLAWIEFVVLMFLTCSVWWSGLAMLTFQWAASLIAWRIIWGKWWFK